jgi:aminoglycoside 6-adenylyltransferase
MRTEAEMLELILGFARDHDQVRAVIMNGSRVSPNVRKDPFQDYDIVYLVREVEPFKRNRQVIEYFGEMLILQTPEDMGDPPPQEDNRYGYLMQFMDGNRIDLTFCPIEQAQACVDDTVTVVLLDKDHRFGELPPPNDRGYLPQPPSAKAFEDCCNEFWWLNPYVAKGLWRDQLTYARYILDNLIRGQLMKMLTWYFGVQTGFQKSPGYRGKYLKEVLDAALWDMLEQTYSDARSEHTWQALFVMGNLFRTVAQAVAGAFGFPYPTQDDANVSGYIRRIRDLPRDALSM